MITAVTPLVALAAVVACAGPRQNVESGSVPERDGFVLVLNNRYPLDLNVFVQHDGQADRVALVVGSTSSSMVLPIWMLGQSKLIRVIAEPVGEDSRYTTDPMLVQPGQVVEVNVESHLSRSSYTVH
ncbi:MAG: hypothetical protein ACREMX_06835 [Gemmatimonadales bacterium]